MKKKAFTNEQLQKISSRVASGETYESISKDYGVHRTTITYLAKNGFAYKTKKYKWSNVWRNVGDHYAVDLFREGELKATMLVSDSDKELTEKYVWRLASTGYALANMGRTPIEFHRLIYPAPVGLVVDHINRNKIDNRRENLRHTTQKENTNNSDRCDIAHAKRIARLGTVNKKHGCITPHKLSNGQIKYRAECSKTYLGMFEMKDDAQHAINNFKILRGLLKVNAKHFRI
jgi:hypothetical protein